MAGHPYTRRKIDGRSIAVHRLVYEEHHGPIPPGYHVHHKDENPFNNDPSNLVALSPEEHGRLHNPDRHPRTKTCEVCGASYVPHPTKRKRSKTCSWDCRNELIRRAAVIREAAKKGDA